LIDKNINISGLTKTITKLSDYSDGSRGKVGENYRLTIGNIQRTTETDGLRDYSGPMSITFPANMVKDTSGNANDAKTITIGVNDPGTGSQQVVDVVSPVWSVASADVNTGIVKIRVKDKYLLKTGTANTALQLTTSEIAVLVNGTESTQVTKTITSGPTLVASGSNGYDTTYEYTIKIGNIAQTTKNYIEFTPKETVVGGKAKYRDENGGSITLRIKAGAVQDAFKNTNAQQDLYVGNVDNTGPEVYDIQKTIAANGDETFVFNITDKNYDSSKVVALNELNITIDGAQFSSAVQKNLTSQTLTDSATNKVLGHQYTLKLTNMKESTSSFASAVTTNRRVYREYSGTIRIVINSNAARDLKGNTLNTATTTITSFNDKLAPEVVYIWSNSVINKNSKTFTMIFDITDKYYSSASLAIGDLTIKIGGKTPNWSSNEVGRSLSVSDIPNAAGKGKRYTLTLSNLQKLQIKSGDKYLDYSGVVTVAIPANKVKDTSGQGNVATTLTSGITIPGGTGSQEVVDVVEPYVQKMSSTVNAPAKTASITVRISDRYFNKSTLTKDTIKVYINGTENASVKTGWSTSEETESRTEKGTTSTVHVATNYTLNMSGFASNINQIKVVVPANVVKDTSGNGNKQTEYIIYNVLRKQDDRDEDDTAPFLGNATVPRKDIDNVTFVSSTAGKNSTKWDVSAQGDSSILAWYTKNSNGTFKVYVGSDYEIFGNTDSSYLFRSVGVSENCTSTETITNIDLLNVSSVTNMRRMFELTGTKAMTKLDLGNNFNTINVTNMSAMFSGTGQKAMTTLNLGSNFNTSRVTNMRWMFNYTGRDKMTSLNLGNNFDTSNAQYMEHMFSNTGYYSMTTLNLGTKFNTSKVTDMSYMFYECGYNALTSLDLGSNFDTSSVTNMESMFCATGFSKLTNLDLGSKFNTIKVTNMLKMFYMTGHDTLTELDLGDKFNTSKVTNMAYMFTWIGRLKTLNLGDNFDTSNVTDMNGMFWGTGYYQMTNFSLGNKFNTKNVQDMSYMFYDFANNITSLDLGDQFYTTNATNMISMFFNCGATKMTSLDLGPAFTQIPSAQVKNWNNTETHEAYYQMFEGTGKTGSIVIHAPESIYQDKNNFKLNTSAATGTVNYTRGTIDPKYRTEWKKESATLNTTNKNIKITLRGTTNTAIAVDQYKSDVTSSLTKSNIKVYIDGVNATETLNKLNAISLGNATQTTENSRTGAKDVLQVVTLSNLEEAARQSGKSYKEWSGNIRLEIDQKTLTDTKYGNKNMAVTSAGARTVHSLSDTKVDKNTSNTMFADFTKPEFTYVYADSDINHTDKTLTAIFKVADKYRASTAFTKKSDGTYDASPITVGIDSYDKTALNNAISKKLTLESERTEEISGQNRVTVQTYKLVIGNLEQKGQGGLSNGYTYSGILTLGFPEGTITDTSGHKSPATTITIGKNEPGGTGTGKPVDVVDPVWSVVSTNADTGVVKLRVKDKYLTKSTSKFNLVKDSIKIIVNGVESTAIVKTLEGPTTIIDGQEYEYTLTLSNIAPSGGGYTEFTPLETIVGGTAKYRNDNGGSITIRIPAGAVTDANGNKTKQQDLNVGNMDLTEPEVYFVQKNRDLANNQETIIFNVTDKNYDSTKLIAANELTTWVDGTQMDSKLTKTISSKTISTTIDGATRVVGHQYTLVLKGFAESDSAFASSGRVYREYSGNLQVKINKDAARDKRGNTLNSSTTTIAQFTDVVRPDIKAKWSDAVINKNNKTFTMIFDVTDKYYSTSTLAIEDLTIKIGGKTPDWSSNEVGRSLSVSDIPGGVGNGKRYTLTLSNLQALQIKSGDKYLDYSGVVTVAIPANKVKDTTGNTNLAKTITSGITIPGGTGSEQEVDVVEPYVQKMSSTVNAVAKTASITVRISDRYFNKSTLTKDTIEVYINGTKNSAVKTGWSTSEETETRTEKGTTSTVHVATNYTLNISGFDSNINQIKVVVPANVVKDTSENGNKQTEYIIYNVLRKQDDKGEDDTAPFLGNATVPRKDIDNVTFVSSTAGKNSTAWDVSAQGDSSILAWYTKNPNGTFKVYVGSDYEIFGNTDSSYLFRSVGLSDYCTSTETITNINLLNVSSVTNMLRMFELTGNQAMTKLDLGDNFNTSNVTEMGAMFSGTGQKAMTSLNLGSNFNTLRVTNMNYMFNSTGRDKMTSLNLGSNFDTSNVTSMYRMFKRTGYTAMTSLNLGSKFNTAKVTDMTGMFLGCGHTAMTSLNLGSNFDTSKVTDMSYMFYECGYNALTSLDLGSNFDTSNVTNMTSMFQGCGFYALTSLDLGSNFDTSNVTNMSSMFFNTGFCAMTSLNLGDNFDTSNVTNMENMFCATGFSKMTNLDLGSKFNTSKVTNMRQMFCATGRFALKNLNLGENFDTSNVINMNAMFASCGADSLTSLDLGDKFYTKNVKDMYRLFANLIQMTSLDLGPAFTVIPDNYVTDEWTNVDGEEIPKHYAYEKMFENNGTQNNLTVYAPESIFQNKNSFKLNASATTGTVNYTRGTINPKYRTEWKKEKVVLDQANDNIKITLRGTTNTSVAENEYISDVTSSLALNKIKVLIDGTDITSTVLNAQGIGNATQTTENSRTGAKDVLQTITLTNFAKAAKRLDGKKYKEWSGNITIEIAQGTLSEKYGNKNMLVATDGTRTVSTVKETNKVSKNTANTMFTDYIKPEFTYSSITDTNIVHGTGRKVEVMFDVTDKYFESTTLSNLNASQITIGMDDYDETELNKAITKKLEKVGTITDTVNGVSNVTVGERYKLTITGLEQQNEKGLSDGYTYSGYMSLKFAKGTIKDKSGNLSDATTINLFSI
jgi:surface protein